MIQDRYSFAHSTTSDGAVQAFEQVVAAVAAHRPAAPLLQTTFAHAPRLPGALALQGLAAVIMASDTSMAFSRQLAAQSAAALTEAGGGTANERAHVEAHALAAHGQLQAAAKRLEAHIATAPKDFLAIKLAHALRFMSGQIAPMLATVEAVLPAWRATDAGYGYLLGCHAFSLEESGRFAEAERTGRQAITHAPNDVWGIHAVAHVMEMGGRSAEGIGWLTPTTTLWKTCGNFGGHLAWHLALFQLSRGEHAAALAVFDHYLKTAATCDFRDVANATSLLWRLEQEGVAVGTRWDAVGRIAHDRRRDTAYVFGTLHCLLALIGSRQWTAAHDLVAALEKSAASGATDQALVAGKVGVELARTLLAMAERGKAGIPMARLGAELGCLGGSIAQRDVFLRTLLLIATETGDEIGTAALQSIRARQRHADGFLQLVARRQSERCVRLALSA
jgi:tetratricopeptide (TPR) repeat protein